MAGLGVSGGENEISCVQDGRVFEHGEDWDVDSCVSCACQVGRALTMLPLGVDKKKKKKVPQNAFGGHDNPLDE